MSNQELEYLRARVEAETAAAEAAKHPKAVEAHSQLAGYYRERAGKSPPDGSGSNPKKAA